MFRKSKIALLFILLCSCSSNKVVKLINEGHKYYSAGQYDEALKSFNNAAELDSKNINALSGKVAVLVVLEHLNEAEKIALFIVESYPKNAIAHYNLGLIEMQMGKYRSSIERFNRSIELDPNFSDPIWNRGMAHDELAEWDKAIADYDLALTKNPDNADALSNRGYTKYKLQDYKGSLQDFSSALEINPKHPKALANMEMLKKRSAN